MNSGRKTFGVDCICDIAFIRRWYDDCTISLTPFIKSSRSTKDWEARDDLHNWRRENDTSGCRRSWENLVSTDGHVSRHRHTYNWSWSSSDFFASNRWNRTRKLVSDKENLNFWRRGRYVWCVMSLEMR